jgi:hypothetical protein
MLSVLKWGTRAQWNTARYQNVAEHNHILRKYRGSKEFKHTDHTIATGIELKTIFYSFVV